MPPRTVQPSAQHGATLIEVLAAIGIGALIVAVVVLAHRTLTTQTARLGGEERRAERQQETLLAFADGLQQLFLPVGDPECGIELENNATGLVRLAFCRWRNLPGRTDRPTNELEHVTYRYDGERDDLLVIRHALTGPEALAGETTNRVIDAWPRVVVALHDGETWQTNWIPAKLDDAQPPRPRAARLMLPQEPGAPSARAATEFVFVIPAGLSVTSTLLRAAPAASP